MTGEAAVTAGIDFPLYVVSDEESGEVLIAAEGIDGFFVAPEDELPEVVFLAASEVRTGRRPVENAVLEVRNRQGGKIGEYFIGRVVPGGTGTQAPDGKTSRVVYRFFGSRCEYPDAEGIWRRWASKGPLERDEWIGRSATYQSAWLHVVQNSWFATGRQVGSSQMASVVYLDGANISTRPGFFCALGEAVNGPGGYFGSNLDALADCIDSSFSESDPVKLVWRNYQMSQRSMDGSFLDSIMSVAREFHLDLVTS